MAAVTIAMIKALQERTGAGIMDCKKALIEADGSEEKAIDILREKGIAKAASKAGRVAAEGLAVAKVCPTCGKAVIAEINCETDFVSGSPKFREFADNVASLLLEKSPKTFEEGKEVVNGLFTDAVVAMRENFVLRRFEIIEPKDGQSVGVYSHMQGKITSLVLLSKDGGDLNKALAMTVTANNPSYLTYASIPEEVKAKETAFATKEVAEDPKLVNKPEAIKAQIVVRKVEKTLSAGCLDQQAYVYDENKTVAQVLKENGVELLKFVRYQVGEGIEKTSSED